MTELEKAEIEIWQKLSKDFYRLHDALNAQAEALELLAQFIRGR